MYKIIENESPYFIRFTHSNIENIVKECKEILKNNRYTQGFTHHRLNPFDSARILNMVPMTRSLNFIKNRVSLFVTQPGYYYRAHKDGLNCRISLNYTVSILDNECVTSWYSDEDLKIYPIDTLSNNSSREAHGFDKSKHSPLKTKTFTEGECILFNTDIFHDFDNSSSNNYRAVLTLRLENQENFYFDDVKKILFPDQL
jgi:hypothetical protein